MNSRKKADLDIMGFLSAIPSRECGYSRLCIQDTVE